MPSTRVGTRLTHTVWYLILMSIQSLLVCEELTVSTPTPSDVAAAKAWIASALHTEAVLREAHARAAASRAPESDWHDDERGNGSEAA
jgi:hypothetical protein